MELRQLLYFVATAEEGSFTRAAVRVHVAQPAISQQIAQLERELGDRLFDRSERRVRLTPAGEAFLPHARAALEAAGAGKDAVSSLRGELTGRLAVGAVPCPPDWLTERLADFRRRHPRVRLTLRTGDPQALTAAVARSGLDAAVIGLVGGRLPAGPAGQRLPAVLAAQDLEDEPLVVALAPGHRLAGAPELSLRDLRDEAVVTLVEGSGLRDVLESACAEAGFVPRVEAETDDLHSVADLVAHGFGVAVLPRSAARRTRRELVVAGLRDPALRRSTALVWHRGRVSLPGRAFLDLVEARETAARPE
ncbi:LysR family transcriptional regulator [Microbispora sp. ATCC PTA-5024]|uniref:LysR family transcriptional regulator n=1 Tax=Microbispora sp. ATCC PTA-5024 TaxID=316330 RepID=UPI0003DD8080|nr:LysR substrate-binding domain-containing protein [Microbispora sp. ATCC PTA-5024]ETK31248.1 hypothetical protein MPTA5024_35950 [Microbispora sp. ATCC PTA-5024]